MTTKRKLKEEIAALERTNDTLGQINALLAAKNDALSAKNVELTDDIVQIRDIASKINDSVKNNSIKAIKEVLKKYEDANG